MERATREIITKGGVKAVLKTYLTYGETEPTLMIENKVEQSKKLMEQAIVSLEGSSENILERLRELPVYAYTEIAQEVSKAVSGDFQPAK